MTQQMMWCLIVPAVIWASIKIISDAYELYYIVKCDKDRENGGGLTMNKQIISDKQIGGHKGTTKAPRAKPKQLERQEQKEVIKWAKWQKYGNYKVSDLLHHSPNGGKRDAREGKHFKEMGTLAGFPDLILFVPRGEYHGLFIEMKQKGGKASDVSESQNAIAVRLAEQGYKFVVCFGANHAIDEIKKYLFGGA